MALALPGGAVIGARALSQGMMPGGNGGRLRSQNFKGLCVPPGRYTFMFCHPSRQFAHSIAVCTNNRITQVSRQMVAVSISAARPATAVRASRRTAVRTQVRASTSSQHPSRGSSGAAGLGAATALAALLPPHGPCSRCFKAL